jgi:hypothetical protein
VQRLENQRYSHRSGKRSQAFAQLIPWRVVDSPNKSRSPCRPAGASHPTGHGQERREAAAAGGVEGRRGDLPPPPLLHRHLRRPDLLQQGKSLLNPSRPLGVCVYRPMGVEPGPIPRRLVAGEEERVLWCRPNAFESGRFSLETSGRLTHLSSVAWACSCSWSPVRGSVHPAIINGRLAMLHRITYACCCHS